MPETVPVLVHCQNFQPLKTPSADDEGGEAVLFVQFASQRSYWLTVEFR